MMAGYEMRDFPIRIWAKGNPGNIMMMYLAGLKLKETLGFGTLTNVEIPLFDIHLPDVELAGRIGLHDRQETNNKLHGALPITGYRNAINRSDAHFLTLDGFYQHLDNFPDRDAFDYDSVFPFRTDVNDHGGEDDLVINIRGGEILRAIHPHYTLLPSEFYAFLIEKTGKRPIFYGQLDESPYLDELKERFPNALFIPSRGIERDFDFIRKSHYIVPALSTFSWMAAWLSNAKKIFFPVAGIFSPMQHPSSMLLPFNDPRYEFYSFPVYFARGIGNYRDYMDPIRNLWQFVESKTLEQICPTPDRSLDAYLKLFRADEYLHLHPELAHIQHQYGATGLINHFCEAGFWEKKLPFIFDEQFYSETYPRAALEVGLGVYPSLVEHYVRAGHKSGYRARP